MKKILVLGCTGMLGSMVLSVLSKNKNFELYGTMRKELTNIFPNHCHFLSFDSIKDKKFRYLIFDHNFDYVINCIGITKPHIKEEKDKLNAIYVNSIFPIELNKLAEEYDFKVIQIATDCVFSGQRGRYTETDSHDTIDVYGKTKSLGEVESDNFLNLRCSIIGPELYNKKFLFEWILGLEDGSKIQGYNNHYWNGITTYHFSKIVEGIIENDKWFSGTQHIVPYDIISKYQLLKYIAEIYNKKLEIECIDKEPMNMILHTNNEERNKNLWYNIYDSIPTIYEMLSDLRYYKNRK